jgi:hypothetical protein
MRDIKQRACLEGAEAIQMHDIRHPTALGSTCFRAKARFLVYADSE